MRVYACLKQAKCWLFLNNACIYTYTHRNHSYSSNICTYTYINSLIILSILIKNFDSNLIFLLFKQRILTAISLSKWGIYDDHESTYYDAVVPGFTHMMRVFTYVCMHVLQCEYACMSSVHTVAHTIGVTRRRLSVNI
jgi:hypothetical protein